MKTQKEIEELWDTLETCIAHRMEFDKAKAKFIAFFSEKPTVFTHCTCNNMVQGDGITHCYDKPCYKTETVADRKMGEGVTPMKEDFETPIDPYAEAKAAYADGELQVVDHDGEWYDWPDGIVPSYDSPPEAYRRKPKQHKYVTFAEALEHFNRGGDFKNKYHDKTFREWLEVTECMPMTFARDLLTNNWALLP